MTYLERQEQFKEALRPTPGLRVFRCTIEVKRVICDERGCASEDIGDVVFSNPKEGTEAAEKALLLLQNEAKFARLRRL